MPLEEVLNFIQQRPFVPFRIALTDGSSYEVRHPEMILAGARSLVIGLAADPAQIWYDRSATVALIHVTRFEPMPTMQPGTNGQQ